MSIFNMQSSNLSLYFTFFMTSV